MNKFLRFSFVALLAMVFGNVLAEDITVAFIPAETKATATQTEVSKDGITLSVTAGTMNRDDNYRVNKGQTLTVTSTIGKIKMIAFTSTVDDPSANYGAKFDADSGIFSADGNAGIWLGESAVVNLTATDHQVRATMFYITVDGNGSTPDTPDTPDDPEEGESMLSKFVFTSYTITDNDNQLVLDFTGKMEFVDVTGKFTFDFVDQICSSITASMTFPSPELALVAYQSLLNDAEKEGYSSVAIDGNTVSAVMTKDLVGMCKISVKSALKITAGKEETGSGLADNPFTPNMANLLAGSLASGENSDPVYVKGKVASIKYTFSANYGTATFFISADGQNDYTFQCYNVYYLENKAWVEGNTQIKEGDEVVICGSLTNYKGNTPETASKKAYVYMLNGVTQEQGETPEPQVVEATCAEIIAGADGTTYRVTGKCTEIVNTLYGNWYLEDATGKVYIYGTLDAEGNTKNFESLGIEVGDVVTVEGPRKTYKETIELVDVKVINITKGGSQEQGLIYSWEGGEAGATEVGGKAVYMSGPEGSDRVNYLNAGNYTLCLNGKKANMGTEASNNGGYIEITLDKALEADDAIEITGYLNKSESKEANIYFVFENGDPVDDSYIFGDADNIDPAVGGKINSHVVKVPAASAGSKTIKMTRSKASTNIFITKFVISRGSSGISTVEAVKTQNGAIYNLAGQKVGKDYKGIVIVNGRKYNQK